MAADGYYDRLLRPVKFNDKHISSAVERLDALETSIGYPFLLQACDALTTGELSKGNLLGILNALENFMVPRYITREPDERAD